ncbi:DNA N-6-adenine-methyltransferase [uncultured Winogradskyella sp.]|uniref:DNA N-6-adenine-methyltransferase n=1 Tax=uncultured Winogradskyella sp. TaxID=395353 RepID=UPI00262ABAA4|nr:DNA N-6-adenine-methyltransferase [uncultured Winogradskyella sp.]
MDKVLFSSKYMAWETPQWLFDKLDKEFGFTLDPCCLPKTAKCKKYFTPKEDGLIQDWSGETVFVNPPYGRSIVLWARKAHMEAKKGTTIVMLLPVRSDTRWFHDWIYGHAEIRLLKGRLAFIRDGCRKGSAPFPSMVVVFNGKSNKP